MSGFNGITGDAVLEEPDDRPTSSNKPTLRIIRGYTDLTDSTKITGFADIQMSRVGSRVGDKNYLDQGEIIFGTAENGGSIVPLPVRMRITADGKVGIGTQIPEAKLSIDGGLHVGGYLDPGNDNLWVDGYASIKGGLHVGSDSYPGDKNLLVDGIIGIGTADTSKGKLAVGGDAYFEGQVEAKEFVGNGSKLSGIRQSQWLDSNGGINYIGNISIGELGATLEVSGEAKFNNDVSFAGGTIKINHNGIYQSTLSNEDPTNPILSAKAEPDATYIRSPINGGYIYFLSNCGVEPSLVIDTANGNVRLRNGVPINEFSNDAAMSDNSDSAVPTQKAVKSYVKSYIDNIQTGYEEGSDLKGTKDNKVHKMWSVKFKNKFSSKPDVILAVNVLDAHNDEGGTAFRLETVNITNTGFTINLYNWTLIRIIGVAWIAYGKM